MNTETLQQRLWTGALRSETLPCCSGADESMEAVNSTNDAEHEHEEGAE